MNIKNLVNETINKAKNTREFEVRSALPEGFEFMGQVPFDLKIADDVITAQVLAESMQEAEEKFHSWLEDCTLGK